MCIIILQEMRDKNRLSCRYHTNNNHPLLLIAPVKEEEAHLDPKIVMYYDVLSDREIEIIKTLAMPKVINIGYYICVDDRQCLRHSLARKMS